MPVSINCFYCPMKNSRKLDSPKRSIIDKKKKRLVNYDSCDNENSDVLVSAVISPYLLTHLHHILQSLPGNQSLSAIVFLPGEFFQDWLPYNFHSK